LRYVGGYPLHVSARATVMTTSTLGKVITMEEAVKLAQEIERLEAVVSAMKAELKTFADVNGPIDTGEKIWGYSESVSWSFTPENLKTIAHDIVLDGKNPWELLSLQAPSLKKLGWSESVLSKYGVKKTIKRFGAKKK
jgi:hypothetical protein